MQKYVAEKYNAFSTKKGNIVWVGTMCLAWNEFAKFSGVKTLQFDTKNHNALKTIQNFNRKAFTTKEINDKSIYFKAGMGPATQTTINQEVKNKFPNYSFGDLKYPLGPQDIISFAYLFKKIKFPTKFKKRQFGQFLFNNQKVASFYADTKSQREQIQVGHYKDRDNFSIKIRDKETSDLIYLLKGSAYTTVDKVIAEVEMLDGKVGSTLAQCDIFQMPVIELDLNRSYEEMVGLHFINKELKQYVLAVMMEAVKLKVDESGAKVQSKAVMRALKCVVKAKQKPKQFTLDKTFWLAMKEQKKHPYLCVQIVDPIEQ